MADNSSGPVRAALSPALPESASAVIAPAALGTLEWAAIAAGAVAVVYALAVAGLVLAGRRGPARAVATFIPDCIVLFKRLLADRRVPRRRKLVLALAVAYLATPVDLVPDFIPLAGQMDDALLVALVLRHLLRGAPPGLLEELWPGPAESLRVVARLSGAGECGT